MSSGTQQTVVFSQFDKALESLVVLLIADGNSYASRLTRIMLTNVGVKMIHEVQDGAAALEAIRAINPDVMILEWDIPVLDGREVMRIMRSPGLFPKPNLPVIMLTDYGLSSRLNEALYLGVHEFLVKPISSKTLQQRLIGILFKPRPMVLTGGFYVPLPRRSIDRDELIGSQQVVLA